MVFGLLEITGSRQVFLDSLLVHTLKLIHITHIAGNIARLVRLIFHNTLLQGFGVSPQSGFLTQVVHIGTA